MEIIVGSMYKISPYKYPDGKCWQVSRRAVHNEENPGKREWSDRSNYFSKMEDAFEFIIREQSRNSGDGEIDVSRLEEFAEHVKSLYCEYAESLARQAQEIIAAGETA